MSLRLLFALWWGSRGNKKSCPVCHYEFLWRLCYIKTSFATILAMQDFGSVVKEHECLDSKVQKNQNITFISLAS